MPSPPVLLRLGDYLLRGSDRLGLNICVSQCSVTVSAGITPDYHYHYHYHYHDGSPRMFPLPGHRGVGPLCWLRTGSPLSPAPTPGLGLPGIQSEAGLGDREVPGRHQEHQAGGDHRQGQTGCYRAQHEVRSGVLLRFHDESVFDVDISI